jgi:hypothetical protein
MPVPWKQIVQLMPSIIEVSKELLRRTHVSGQPGHTLTTLSPTAELEERVTVLEDNEQRQAELSRRMAEQLAQLTTAVTVLHRLVRWLVIGVGVSAALALAALVMALH